MDGPQYYQYNYTAAQAADNKTGSFSAVAVGDLNGDGVESKFTRAAEIRNGQIVLSPAIEEENPDE
ncbi:MAG TPA: hypothetical protein VER04_20010, partial [Polyangiaceae bacterium]|nr:hypothetical protein [Polyangiaceae bacterium]